MQWSVQGRSVRDPAFDPGEAVPDAEPELPLPLVMHASRPRADIHLRSTDAVKGYHVETADGSLGRVSDFIYDDEAWVIRYLIVDTHNGWLGGKDVLIATHRIDAVDWFASKVSTPLTRDVIQHTPAYDDSVPLHHSYEIAPPVLWQARVLVDRRRSRPGDFLHIRLESRHTVDHCPSLVDDMCQVRFTRKTLHTDLVDIAGS